MDVKDAITSRNSIRRYTESVIPEEELSDLFRALQMAPSASNGQNWEFVFVGDRGLKKRLVSACSNQKFVGECSYFIAGLSDPAFKWHMVDITIAMTNFTLQAVELGYGTCWVGAFDEMMVKEVLGVPENRKVVICMAFGKADMKAVPRDRKPIDTFVFLDRYGRPWGKN